MHTEESHKEEDFEIPYAYIYEYDPFEHGRLTALRLPQAGEAQIRSRLMYNYDQWGNAKSVSNSAGDLVYYAIEGNNAFGQPTIERYGGGWQPYGQSVSWKNYDSSTGELNRIESWSLQPYSGASHLRTL